MINKPVIAITSILKPVDDARNYEKIAYSLGKTNKYEVHIYGFKGTNYPKKNDFVVFHPLFDFKRTSIHRLWASWKIYKNILRVNPDVIIINTHELLWVMCIYKILFGSKLLYDVQENYKANLQASKAYPPFLKHALALYVRAKEYITAPLIDLFVLAERCYEHELTFLKKRYITLENKYLTPYTTDPTHKNESEDILIVYTGTIAEEYGIFDAIEWVKKLREVLSVKMEITGYCPNEKTFRKLELMTLGIHYINLSSKNTLVPHNQILKQIQLADFAILPYRERAYYTQRVPTKLYECLALNTPMLIRYNQHWQSIYEQIDAFVFTDFKHVDDQIIHQLTAATYFQQQPRPFWYFDENKLIGAIEQILKL